MKTIRRFTAVFATALFAGGCAANPPAADAPLAPNTDETVVSVENNNWSDMVVYAVRYNTRVRLGLVTSMNQRQFKLPRGMHYDSVDLVADPVGSPAIFRTGPININPGQRVELKIQNLISVSSWSVW